MKRWIWLVLAVFAAWAAYGFLHERLFHQDVWKPEGVVRMAAYTGVYWAAAGLILWLRPAWLLPIAAGFVFVYSEWWCWRFFSPLAPFAVIYFLGSCLLLGRIVASKVDVWIAVLVGLAVWVFLLSLAVHFPVNTRVAYAAAFAIPYFVRRAWPPMHVPLPGGNPGTAVLSYVLMMHWLVALKPEASSDGLAMHLAIPAMIANDGRFSFDFQQYTWALMPMNGDLAFTATYLLGGEAGARLLNFAILGVIVAIVYRASTRWLSPARAALVAALFASTPLVQLVTGSLFVENVWAALIVGAAVALWSGEVTAAGILLGSAFATKVGTSAFLLPAAVLAAMALRRAEHRARTAAAACACLIVLAAPPFVYAYAKTGNPIFPFANTFFRSPYFDTAVPLQDVRYLSSRDWNAVYNLAFRSKKYIEGHNGALGFQYFLLLPPLLLLLLFRRDAPRAPVLFGLTGALITFASVPNLRYLYPAMPLISIGLAWMIAEMPLLAIAASAMLALNVWFMPAAGWYHGEFGIFTRAQFDYYLSVSGPQRKLIEIVNRTLPGEPVAFLHGDTIAGFHAKAYSDTWHTYRFWRRMITPADPGQVAALFRELGIHYIITPKPSDSEYLVVQHFLEEWTAPAGATSGDFELRKLLATPVVKPRDTTPALSGSYDDLDQRIEYSHGWLHDRQFPAASGGTITYANRPGETLRFFFNGTSIRYVYTTTFNRGTVEVAIDKKVRARLNLYSEDTHWQQQTLFKGLDPGAHTIELRVIDRKGPKSSGYYVDLDRFDVNP